MPDLGPIPLGDILDVLRDRILPIAIIVLVAALISRAASLATHRLVQRMLDREASEGTAQELSAVEIKKRIVTLDTLLGHGLRFFVVVIAGLMIIGELGFNIGPAVAGLGVVGVALGFGAQSLVRDYLNGALILLENQFSRGDVVRLAGVAGVVEDFTLRRTTLRDIDGVVHTVPNGEIHVASNMTRIWARVNEDVQVAYGTDLDRATEVINQVGREMLADPAWHRRVLEAPKVERVEALGDSGVALKVLGSVRAGEQWAARGELRRRVYAAFQAAGIEIPFPHRVVVHRTESPDGFSGPAPATDEPAASPAQPAKPRSPSRRRT